MQARIILDTSSSAPPVQGSLLPCLVKYSGPAPVADHFHPVELDQVAGEVAGPQKEAYFRGRRLLGSDVAIPTGYKAFVLDNSAQAQTQPMSRREEDEDEAELEEVRTFKVQAALSSLTCYGNANLPDPKAPVNKIEAWLALSQVLHNTSNPA
ncbi:ribonuclease H2, subunit C [Protomyces lactucae-debilis]|uniref:Ribonuclease H2, subunit C n=1 Tax=Protomyces lactucae-debilis TaxID=2754530 RepID=A0A1Y2FK68_PROLT|nr:ribonuclease H2, subunit C [Protomyces lactucae-debilis]ORY84350.1 ribonuclease H2, subunit C [Protomyces lactucae-debilis]